MTIDIGAIIKTRRNELGLSQMALALDTGVTQETVSNIEIGKSDPYLSTVLKLTDALGLKLEVVEK